MNTREFNRIRQAAKKITEADDKPTFSAPAKPAKPPKIDKPDPQKDLAPSKPAPAAKEPPKPVPPSEDRIDAVKKLNKMAEKVFKALDDMAVFANQNGLKDVAQMIGKTEEAYWEMKKGLAKIRESKQ